VTIGYHPRFTPRLLGNGRLLETVLAPIARAGSPPVALAVPGGAATFVAAEACPAPLNILECQAANMFNSDACPRPTTGPAAGAAAERAGAAALRAPELLPAGPGRPARRRPRGGARRGGARGRRRLPRVCRGAWAHLTADQFKHFAPHFALDRYAALCEEVEALVARYGRAYEGAAEAERRPCVVVVEAADELFGLRAADAARWALRWLPAALPGELRIVVCSLERFKVAEPRSELL
jgi:hypothetical protein